MQVIKECFKFIESDIFIYVERPNLVYLIYIDQLAFIKEVTEEASSSLSSSVASSPSSVYSPKQTSNLEKKESSIKEASESNIRSIKESKEKKAFGTVINMLNS